MSSIKGFLIGFVVVYMVAGLGLNLALGPPGFSREYLDAHKADNDYYLETIKSDAYKLWRENADLNPPSEDLAARIAFVEQYETLPEFIAEQSRRGRYDALTDVFNAFMLLVLVVRLGRGPVAKLIDGMVAEERTRIETVEQERSAAARRKTDAQRTIDDFEAEREEAHGQVEKRIAAEAEEIESTTEHALTLVRQEAEDRKRQEEALARLRLKEEMIDSAIEILEKRYCEANDPAAEAALVNQFLSQLGESR